MAADSKDAEVKTDAVVNPFTTKRANPAIIAVEQTLDACGVAKILWGIIVGYYSSVSVTHPYLFEFVCANMVLDRFDYKHHALERFTNNLLVDLRTHADLGWSNLNDLVAEGVHFNNDCGPTARPSVRGEHPVYCVEPVNSFEQLAPDLQVAAYLDFGVVLIHNYIRVKPADSAHTPDDVLYVDYLVQRRLGAGNPWHLMMAAAAARPELRPVDYHDNLHGTNPRKQKRWDVMMGLAAQIHAYHTRVPGIDPCDGVCGGDCERSNALIPIRKYCRAVTRRRMGYRDPDAPDSWRSPGRE